LEIKYYFDNLGKKLGHICKGHVWVSDDQAIYRISNIQEINNVLLVHFDKYKLITQKYSDYLLFRDAIKSMVKQEHLTSSGLENIN
jgi:hypothetical protein